jgi:chemotaxis protein histidine kinase CheA
LDTAILEQQAVVETTRIQAEGQIRAAERNAEYLKTFLDFVTFPQRKIAEFFEGFVNGSIDILNKLGLGIEKIDVGKAFEDVNNFIVKQVFDPAAERKNQEQIVKDAEKSLNQLNEQRAGIINQQNASEKAAAQKAADDKAKAAKDAADAQLKAEQEVSDLLNQLYEENVKEFEDAEKEKTAAAEAEAQKRLKAEEEYDAAITSLRAEQDAANLTQDQKDIIAIDNKYLDLREKAIAAGESTVEIDAAYTAALEAQEQQSAERRKANEAAVQDAKLQSTSDALGAINGLVAAFTKGDEKRAKRAFQVQKALSIAQATVDTYKGANAIFTAAANNPATILFPAQPFIAAGVAIASGLANVATIAQQQFQGGTSGGGGGGGQNTPSFPEGGGTAGGGGGTGSQPAQFNPLASSFLQDRPEQLTPRAYVLAGDVASQQEVREKVQDLARIG